MGGHKYTNLFLALRSNLMIQMLQPRDCFLLHKTVKEMVTVLVLNCPTFANDSFGYRPRELPQSKG